MDPTGSPAGQVARTVETWLGRVVERALGSERLVAAVQDGLLKLESVREALRQRTGVALRFFNVATTEDLEKVSAQLARLEELLARLERPGREEP